MAKKKALTPKLKPKGNSGISKPLVYGPVAKPSATSKKSEPKKN